MKKLTSFILVFSLLVGTMGSVFAYSETMNKAEVSSDAKALLKQDLGTEFLQAELIETVESDLAILKSKISSEDFSIESMDDDGNFCYSQTYPSGGMTYFTVGEDTQGNIQLDCFEEGKHDQLIYTPDGTLFLDGFEIIPEIIEEEISGSAIPESATTPRAAGFENYYSIVSSIPGGYQSMSGHGTSTSANLPLDKPLKKLTIGGLAGLICNGVMKVTQSINFWVGGWSSALQGVALAGAEVVADRMLNYMQYLGASYADSTSASFKGLKYFKTGSSIAPRYIYQFKYYSKADFVDTSYTGTTYVLQEQDPR